MALLRENADGESMYAPSADTCTNRSTPLSAHTCASTLGNVELTSWKDQRDDSMCLPSRLMTTLQPSTAASMSSSLRMDVCGNRIMPRSVESLRRPTS